MVLFYLTNSILDISAGVFGGSEKKQQILFMILLHIQYMVMQMMKI